MAKSLISRRGRENQKSPWRPRKKQIKQSSFPAKSGPSSKLVAGQNSARALSSCQQARLSKVSSIFPGAKVSLPSTYTTQQAPPLAVLFPKVGEIKRRFSKAYSVRGRETDSHARVFTNSCLKHLKSFVTCKSVIVEVFMYSQNHFF